MNGEEKGGETVVSVKQSFEIIDALRELSEPGVTELARHLGIAKSTVHRHLSTMQESKYVKRTEEGYQLGLEFLEMGVFARDSYELYDIGKEKTVELAEKTGERTWIMVEENDVGWYLCGASGEHPVFPPVRVGQKDHLHKTAAGKAILAHLSEGRVREIVSNEGLPAETANTITELETLLEELDAIRDRGVSFNEEESLLGLHAIGAPIKNHRTGDVFGALSLSGPANRVNLRGESEFTDLILGTANEIEINLSYS